MEFGVSRVSYAPSLMSMALGVSKDELAMRARRLILNMQEACERLPDGVRMDESPPLRHHLTPGVYAREIHLAAGSLIVGKIHRGRHLNIISQGRVTVFTEFGEETYQAPATFVSDPGTKRVVLTLEDAIWTTIHPNPTDEQDVPTLERAAVADHYEEMELLVAPKELPWLFG